MTRYGLQGDENVDAVLRELMNTARSIWPEQTAEAEAWIAARAASYGIDYAKYKAGQAYQAASEWVSNPLILLGLGLLGGYLIFKR